MVVSVRENDFEANMEGGDLFGILGFVKENSTVYSSIVNEMTYFKCISHIIAYTKKYLQSDQLRGVQYWPYLYSVFNICTLELNERKKQNIQILQREKQKCIH